MKFPKDHWLTTKQLQLCKARPEVKCKRQIYFSLVLWRARSRVWVTQQTYTRSFCLRAWGFIFAHITKKNLTLSGRNFARCSDAARARNKTIALIWAIVSFRWIHLKHRFARWNSLFFISKTIKIPADKCGSFMRFLQMNPPLVNFTRVSRVLFFNSTFLLAIVETFPYFLWENTYFFFYRSFFSLKSGNSCARDCTMPPYYGAMTSISVPPL